MDYLRGLIDGAVRESQAAWDRSTGYVALTKRQTIDYVKDKKDETTGLVKSKIDHVTEQYSEISNVVTTNIKDIKEEARRGREQLAPTLEFFHLHPVVSSLSVGFGVQAVRIFLMRPMRLRLPMLAAVSCYLLIKTPQLGQHIENLRKGIVSKKHEE